MAEPQSKQPPHTDFQVIRFIVILCFVCGLLLALAAYGLRNVQREAREFDRSKQMLIAAKILDHAGYFQIEEEDGTTRPAQYDPVQHILVKVEDKPVKATEEEIKEISNLRIRPLLTTPEGKITTFEQMHTTLPEYLEKSQTTGYAHLPNKLFYAILPNQAGVSEITDEQIIKDPSQIAIFVIPVSGFGLWAPIYGFIALGPNGNDVIGTTWYEHAETPGLGANITEAWWQKQFYGKVIFQESSGGKVDLKTADIGIIVVKGKVADVFGTTPKAKSAVDGISGATLTGDGVTAAYKNSLTPYREFLSKVHGNG